GRRRRDQPERSARRHLPRVRRRRPARQQDRFGDPDHASADRHRRRVPGRALAAQEPRPGDVAAPGEAAGRRGVAARGRDSRAQAQPRRHRRPLRADPHLQLPAGSGDRQHDQHDPLQARSDHGRRPRRGHRCAHEGASRGSARGARDRRVNAPARQGGESLGTLRAWGAAVLAPSDTARLDAELLLADAAGVPRAAVIAFPERTVDAAAAARFRAAVARRAAGEPLAYLVGRKEFYGLPLDVAPAVLVPRPETELVVEQALARLPPEAPCTVLDLGTGSGAIALAIASERPLAAVTAVDSSAAATEVARRGARVRAEGGARGRRGRARGVRGGAGRRGAASRAGRRAAPRARPRPAGSARGALARARARGRRPLPRLRRPPARTRADRRPPGRSGCPAATAAALRSPQGAVAVTAP